jgi:hypothetical protein
VCVYEREKRRKRERQTDRREKSDGVEMAKEEDCYKVSPFLPEQPKC